MSLLSIRKLYDLRFEIFLFSEVLVLFGSLIIPPSLYSGLTAQFLSIVNLLAGILLIHKNRKLIGLFVILLILSSVAFASDFIASSNGGFSEFLRISVLFLFYAIVTFEIIKQVWETATIGRKVIYGLISGYLSLGLVGFFICLSIEIADPGSFMGLHYDGKLWIEELRYYAYITILTIGYGDIIPVTPLSQKAAVLIGLMGQFYIVIITAVVIEKYIRHRTKEPGK